MRFNFKVERSTNDSHKSMYGFVEIAVAFPLEKEKIGKQITDAIRTSYSSEEGWHIKEFSYRCGGTMEEFKRASLAAQQRNFLW